ncbi:PTS fructose transporter subunit IIC [Clostridium grantii]|uniref:PTS system D-fructose-specific IIB component (F1P-forming), Frc family /PTS system D-fructose-specific IIC component (F1P-forming), Frc family n=1 Tax=Clostridium grantii DSM 8605 TaxID=1121316 RepID=A0A1M5SAD8_9CLOT|nr:fructose-specific PTS transporter subunit EIIC [Clostridium grantii]SHH35592.1 PTS system D-fructose-specific IIB component (F1P-forming), Frc family /PTS system D-fructose-specific IIC component (F1P-forming), Frc family [Clostridium grantii DSM 8605]
MKILAVTACPTGIAHTYMAAEAIEQAAKAKGYEVKVETRGSVGVENELTAADIKSADAIILACDTSVPMDRFAGKKLISVPVAEALKNTGELIERALKSKTYKSSDLTDEVSNLKAQRSEERQGFYKHLMNGVSFMIPFVVAGGILIALSFIFGYDAFQTEGTLPAYLMGAGGAAFGLMVPILAGYIAYSIADRPGLAPGMIGGSVAVALNAGFLGGLAAGFLAGYTVVLIKKYVKLPKSLQGIMPVLVIPVLGSLIVGLLLYYVIGTPVAAVNTAMNNFLTNMSGSNAVVLGLIIGLMMAFDMGGPVNKAAYAFGTGTLVAGSGSAVMAAVMAAGMVPPLGLGIATLLFKNKFSTGEREAGKAALVLGASFITEGAIPFAAADPIRVIPSIMIGSALTGALSMAFNATLSVPHGGIFVFFAVGNWPLYVVAILAGSIVSALCVGFAKKAL